VVAALARRLSVDGQATALREGVMNLILNAIDAMPQGGRLGLTARRVDSGVEVQVSDTGEGMREDIRRRIFDPFFTTRAPHRTGLGLSVVQGIVSRHRGSVHVRSEPGGGTTVTLWFPAGSGHDVEAPPLTAEPGKAIAPPVVASILVLEDEDRIRAMLVEALASAGHHVESATDGLTGLARFQGGAFDVVLTDLSLPECSGLDVASSVKRLRPHTPVILITGWGHLLDPEKLREAGVDLMLVKPFRLERVLAVLADALRLRPSA
jgi:two-component system, cell cycle sensor histidine kinase and response regulator CckA